MNQPGATLTEKKGIWYLNGVVVRIGDQLRLSGVPWRVVGFGRTRSPEQRSFLWIQNPCFGMTIYNPASSHAKSGPILVPIAQALAITRASFKNN
jgi:hypothetical protein